ERVKERVIQIQKSLPEGVVIEPYLVRDKLVSTAMGTVKKNLLEGGLIVIFILVLMLGNWRAGLIVASVIPLSMLFAISMMNMLGISANLMSLGALDFGLIVDGAVIIVETIIHRLQINYAGQKLTKAQMDQEVKTSSIKIMNASSFGMIIILMVYIPILALVGIEGKMFKPMAETVMLAIGGALILSLTYVPMMSALFLKKKISTQKTIADRIIAFFQKLYTPIIHLALRLKAIFVLATIALFAFSLYVFSQMGGEFIPTLEEGDLAMQQISPPGTSLTQSIEMSKMIHKKLMDEFPEILDVVTNIGAAEIPTDPMPVEIGDGTLIMKPKSAWTSATNRKEMFEKIEASMKSIPGVGFEFSQPIQLRFNELMTGSKADIAVKIYGDDLDVLFAKAKEAEKVITTIKGVGTVNVEQTVGMPQIIINYKYDKMAQYGLQVKEVNQVVRAAFAGESAGVIYEGEKRFDLVIRLDEKFRKSIDHVQNLYITLDNGTQVPIEEVASVELVDAPMQISRDNTNRRIVIGVNVGDTDIETLVEKIQSQLDTKIDLPTGYYFTYGGQFENLKAANARLMIAVPLALALIFILLFLTFGSISQAALIFTAIPLSAIGGIWALQLRGMPFSISAGIGFIALFGVAVLNGIVLIGYFNQLKSEGVSNIRARILKGTSVRLRPVLMTASVASLGFLPMALSTSGGAEVQRPLATVVIGGLISATFLTLVVLPILYSWLAQWKERNNNVSTFSKNAIILLPFLFFGQFANAQKNISVEEAIEMAIKNHPNIRVANLQVASNQALQNFAYSPGSSEISYSGDGLFRANGNRVNQIGFTQNFPNPSVYKANNSLQNELVKTSLLQKKLTINTLTLEVRQTYYNLQHKKELRKLYQYLILTYANYFEKAKLRVELGAANNIEALSIQSAMNEYKLLEKQIAIEIKALEQQLRLMLNSNEPVSSTDSLQMLPFHSLDTINSISMQLAQQNIQVSKAVIPIFEASKKAKFSVGYALQKYYEGGWLNAFQAGVKLPLFNKPTDKRIEAQKIQIELAKAQLEVKTFNTNQKLLAIDNSIRLYAEGINYYQKQIENINPEIERIAKLNYQAGEISYLELLNTLKLLADNNKTYWEQILAYNQAVVLYQFLANQ
ncbi:MAG TPA: CusA/CzcA family heavy metal efflux RND transporter, partial [Saprospiraceae bacterium]|nr:CusA/CzcA family heavy metal efflux RND transporter [Saprospiraceae bacterium]